jgi:hypothetical protein
MQAVEMGVQQVKAYVVLKPLEFETSLIVLHLLPILSRYYLEPWEVNIVFAGL